jgi:hypothetical protein
MHVRISPMSCASPRSLTNTKLSSSVPFVLLDLEIEDLAGITGLWLHPLTRLAALRHILQYDVPEIADTDKYRFTLDGETFLNESSRLWDLDIASGTTVYLCKPRRAFSCHLLLTSVC